MGRVRSFRDDVQISRVLDAIPHNERSTIIRIALRRFFAIEENTKGVVMNDNPDPKDSQAKRERL